MRDDQEEFDRDVRQNTISFALGAVGTLVWLLVGVPLMYLIAMAFRG